MFVIYALLAFVGNILTELFESVVIWVLRRGREVASRLLIALAVFALANYFFQPAVQLYKLTAPQADEKPTTIFRALVGLERRLLAISNAWNIRLSLGITAFHLGEVERLDWNRHLRKVFSEHVDAIRFDEVDGWLHPIMLKETRKVRHLVTRWRRPSDFYLYPATKHDAGAVKGIYLSGGSTRAKSLRRHIAFVKSSSSNAIVFDVKDVTGFVNYPSRIKDVQRVQRGIRPPIDNLKYTVAIMKAADVYSIARISLFQDQKLVGEFPAHGINLKSGAPLLTNRRRVWVDPAKKAVQEYNLKLIWEVLKSGVDEVQMDYIRYPAEGPWREAVYQGLTDHYQKPPVIAGFLQKVHALTRSHGVALSIDVFGVVAWQEKLDIKSTGQDLRLLGQATDIISPMLYPSHFGTFFAGIHNPADSPYKFIEEGCRRIRTIIPKSVHVRPWLQAFKWRVTNYNGAYITRQIEGAYATKALGYLLWNAGNKYIPYQVPPTPTLD